MTKRFRSYEESHRTVGGVKQKLCCRCKKWKDESLFCKNRSSKDGLIELCKECLRKKRRLANKMKGIEMKARRCWIGLVLGGMVVVMAGAASIQTSEPKGREWVEQTQDKWLRGVQKVNLRLVVECAEIPMRNQVEAKLRLNAMRELRSSSIAILPASQLEEEAVLPVLRISLIMTRDPMRRQSYYYCAALVEHIEPCTLFRTKDIGMANCWGSGPVLIGGQVKEIVQRIDLCVREYTKAITQANSQVLKQSGVQP